MTEVRTGDTVRIHFTGTLSDSTVFDGSRDRAPLEFTVGSGQIIPGLDRALPGMEVGGEKTVEVAAVEAYGPTTPPACRKFRANRCLKTSRRTSAHPCR